MGVLSSLYTGVSGLQAQGEALGVIGDNIANANTTGFKHSRAEFQDIVAKSLKGVLGGNQIGRGVKLGAVNPVLIQGNVDSAVFVNPDSGVTKSYSCVVTDSGEMGRGKPVSIRTYKGKTSGVKYLDLTSGLAKAVGSYRAGRVPVSISICAEKAPIQPASSQGSSAPSLSSAAAP